MNLSRESALALQRHYVGALSTPTTTWLEPVPAARLAFAGGAIRVDRDGCVVDFGAVDLSRDQKRVVRVFLPGSQRIDVSIAECPAWLATEWTEGKSLLIIRVTVDTEGERTGALSLAVRDEKGPRVEALRVRIVAVPRQPFAAITFNGSLAPAPFAFGTDGATFTISVANRNSVPLMVSISDLPEWLEMTVDGCTRNGPLPGRFFERAAPFTMAFRPRLLGRHEGVIRMQTNDRNAELRDLALPLTADLAPLRPHLRVIPPSEPVASSRKKITAHARLENWGRSPARIRASSATNAVTVPASMRVAASSDGRPGTASLPIRIAASQLEQGTHRMLVTLQVEDGEPAQATVPVQVNVAAAPAATRLIRSETVAAIVALLLLTIALLSVARGWS